MSMKQRSSESCDPIVAELLRVVEAESAAVDGREGVLALNADEITHDALASDLGQTNFLEKALYVREWKCWVMWGETRWCRADQIDVIGLIRVYMAERATAFRRRARITQDDNLLSVANKMGSEHWIFAVEKLSRSNPNCSAHPDSFDADPCLLCTPGGVVDLRTGVMRPAVPTDMVLNQTRYAPEKGSPARFLAAISEAQLGRNEVVECLRKFVGYGLTGSTSLEKILFFHGDGGNGKSLFLDTVEEVAGSYAVRAPDGTFSKRRGSGVPAEAAFILDGRIVISSEIEGTVTFNEGLLKDLAGSTAISTRNLYEKYHTRKPRALVILMGNYLPDLMTGSAAMKRRLIVVPWPRRFAEDEQIPGLKETIWKEETPQILNWLIEGAVAFHKEGIEPPIEWVNATKDFFEEADMVQRFLDEMVIFVPEMVVARSIIYEAFGTFCRSEGIRNPPSATNFYRSMREKGHRDRKSGVYVFEGIRLKQLSDVRNKHSGA